MSIPAASFALQMLTVSVADRSEIRARTDSTTQAATSFDALTQGRLALLLDRPRASVELVYSPQFTSLSIGRSWGSQLVLQSGSLIAQARPTRRLSISLSEAASYGEQNFRILSVSAPNSTAAGTTGSTNGTTPPAGTPQVSPTAQSTPVDRSIRFDNFLSTGTVAYQLSPRWLESSWASYNVVGGVGQQSRLSYPEMRVLQGRQGVTHIFTRRSTVTLTLGGSTNSMPTLMTYYAASIDAEWNRRFGPNTTGSFLLGPTYWVWVPTIGAQRHGVLPVVMGMFQTGTMIDGGRATLSVQESLMPMVDRLLGTLYPQWTSGVSATYTKGRVTVSASGNFILNIGGVRQSARYVGNTAESIAYRLSRHFVLEGGSRQGVMVFNESIPTGTIWAGYVALSYTSGGIRL